MSAPEPTNVILLAPPASTWQGYTAVDREGPNRDWVPLNSGVFVGDNETYLATLYESGDQEDVEPVSEIVRSPVFSRTMAGEEDDTAYPPAWDGSSTAPSPRMQVRYSVANPESFIINELDVYKATYEPAIPEGAVVTGAYLRFSPSQLGGGAPFIGTGVTPIQHLAPGSYFHYTEPESHYCSPTDTLTQWDSLHYDVDLEEPRLTSWSAEWAGNHGQTLPGDYKAGTSGTALSGMPVVVDDLYSTYGDGNGNVLVPLADWESEIANNEVSLIFSIDDTPLSHWMGTYVQISLGVWNSEEYNAAHRACPGSTTIPDVVINPTGDATFGGLTFGGAPQLVITVEPFTPVGEKPSHLVEHDQRGIVYFDLTELPEGDPVSVDLLFWAVYAWSSEEGSTVYAVPIDPTNPSQEGPMPIEVERHHPVGLEDKSSRAVWSSGINALEISGPELIEVPLSPTILSGLEQIGFQFAIKPETGDPFTFHYFDVFTEIGSGSPHSPYTGPRLRVSYGETGITLTFNVGMRFYVEPLAEPPPLLPVYLEGDILLGLEAPTLQVEAELQPDPRHRVLDHRANSDRIR